MAHAGVITRTSRQKARAAWCAVVVSCGIGGGGESVAAASQTPAVHLRVDDTIGDILQHSAFAGFGVCSCRGMIVASSRR